MGIPEKIKAIQDEIGRTQLNKATEHHIGLLKAKIAKLKREQEAVQIKKSSKKSDGFDVRRSGDATVVFIGLPSVGKSTLLNALTGSKSSVGAFQFTTVTVVPGILDYRGAKIQMLDLPGIIKGASSGKGLGKRILSVARSADIVLLVLDVFQPYHEDVLVNELSNIGLRLNQQPPNILIEKSTTGGIAIAQQVKLKKMSEKLVKDILNVYGYTSKKLKTEFIPVSANANDNISELRDRIYDELQFIRIYMRPKGGKTDYKEPLIIRSGNSVLDVCNKLHRKLRKDFRYGLVWGKSVKFGGQRVGLKHILHDEDVLTIIKTKGT